jgi:lipopolysaccharide assembly protein A
MQIFNWLFRAFVFFALFAFALNNRHEATVRWFFGWEWRAPMVFVVLGAFAIGCACGVVAMVPRWWKQRRRVARVTRDAQTGLADTSSRAEVPVPLSESALEHPPRDGL